MLDALENSSRGLEAARSQISHIVDEMRMQTSLSRERLRWLTAELDKLQDLMRKSSPPGASP
jgi:uncharacterized coiled-coil protein SlyX